MQIIQNLNFEPNNFLESRQKESQVSSSSSIVVVQHIFRRIFSTATRVDEQGSLLPYLRTMLLVLAPSNFATLVCNLSLLRSTKPSASYFTAWL